MMLITMIMMLDDKMMMQDLVLIDDDENTPNEGWCRFDRQRESTTQVESVSSAIPSFPQNPTK